MHSLAHPLRPTAFGSSRTAGTLAEIEWHIDNRLTLKGRELKDMPDNNESLLPSAQQFLAEAMRDFRSRKLSFAIVHTVTATELVLKERLRRIHPALMYRNIDTKDPRGERTVALAVVPRRLANLGEPLDRTQARLIDSVSAWRHEIVHHMPTFKREDAELQLPRLLDFLATYLRQQMGTPLKSFLPRDLWSTANQMLSDWQTDVAVAKKRAVDEGGVIADPCPRCAAEKVMTLRDGVDVHCHLCEADLYRCRCAGCGRETVVSYAPLAGENFCDRCIDAAGDQYISWHTDYLRGK